MSLTIYQSEIDKWIKKHKVGYFSPHEILARLVEEVGEIAREVNHRFGPKKKKSTEKENELGGELADVVFTVVCMANSLGINLDKEFKKMMTKIKKRDKNRYEKK